MFVTIATSPRRPLLGKVVDGEVRLSLLGEVVRGALDAMPGLNRGLSLYGRVVMPDHVHFNCSLAPGLAEPLKLFGYAIRRFKNFTTKQAKVMGLLPERSSGIMAGVADAASLDGPRTAASLDDHATAASLDDHATAASLDGQTAFGHLWQQGCHDYLLVSREMIDSTERYIAYNPLKCGS